MSDPRIRRLQREGLHRVLSELKYHKRKRVTMPPLYSRVFRVTRLHQHEAPSSSQLLKNRQGFTDSTMETAALVPSATHYLFHKCGISFEETKALAETGRLKRGDKTLALPELEAQHMWKDVACSGITIDMGNGVSVPVEHRPLHRYYRLVYINPKMRIGVDVTDPRGVVSRLRMEEAFRVGANLVKPMGLVTGMSGIGIVTNDVTSLRYTNNEFLGNFGVYDLRFPRGTPPEVRLQFSKRATSDIQHVIKEQLRDLVQRSPVKYGAQLTTSPPVDGLSNPTEERLLEPERLVITTPRFPFRLYSNLSRYSHSVTLVRMGPFVLRPALMEQQQRPLTSAEVRAFFTWERAMKVNRVVLTLREFDEESPPG